MQVLLTDETSREAAVKKRQKTAWIVSQDGVFLRTSKSGARLGFHNAWICWHFGRELKTSPAFRD
jgi:hypothetical protein